MYDRDSLRGGGGGESYARICVSLAAAVSVVTLVSGDRSGMGAEQQTPAAVSARSKCS